MSDTEHKVAVSVQMRLEQMLGADEVKRQFAEFAQEAMNVGKEFNANVKEAYADARASGIGGKGNDVIEMQATQNVINKRTKQYTQDINNLMDDFTFDESVGMTKAGYKSYAKQFRDLKNDYITRIDEDIEYQQKRLENKDISDEARQTIEHTLSMYDGLKVKISDTYDGMVDKLRESVVQTRELKNESQGLMDVLRQGGWLMLGREVLRDTMAIAQTQIEIDAKQKTSFDLRSPQAMFFEQEQFELFESTKERSLIGKLLGAAGGAIAGGALAIGTGGVGAFAVPGMIAGGAAIGGGIGDQIAGFLNLEESSEKQKEWKFLQQTFAQASQYYERAKNYEITATRLSGRAGQDVRGTEGFGYTMEQELAFKEMFESQRGSYDADTYREQLAFARANYLNPETIFQFGSAEKVLGERWGAGKLESARGLAKEIFGEGASESRVLDVLNNLKEIATQQLQLDIEANSRDLEKFLSLPNLIFGQTAYGTDLSGQTLNNLQGLMQPKSDAHLTFLYQALGKGGSVIDFMEKMKGGIFDGSNFEDITKAISGRANGFEEAYYMLNEMMPNTPKGFNKQIAELLGTGKTERITGYFTEDGKEITRDQVEETSPGNYFTNVNGKKVKVEARTEAITQEEFMAQFKDLTSNIGRTTEEAANEIFNKAVKAGTSFETLEEKVSKVQTNIGKQWEETINQSRERMLEIEQQWLTSQKSFSAVSGMIEKGFDALINKMDELGLYSSPEAINKKYEKEVEAVNQSLEERLGTTKKDDETVEQWVKRSITKGEKSGEFNKETGVYIDRSLTEEDIENNILRDYKNKTENLNRERNNILKRANFYNNEEAKYIEEEREKAKVGDGRDIGKSWREDIDKRWNDFFSKHGFESRPISGFRTKEQNEKAGGGENSLHLAGLGRDYSISYNGKQLSNEELFKNETFQKLNKEFLEQNPDVFWGGEFKSNSLKAREQNHYQYNPGSGKITLPLESKMIKEDEVKQTKNKQSALINSSESPVHKNISNGFTQAEGNTEIDIPGLLNNLVDKLSQSFAKYAQGEDKTLLVKFVDTPTQLADHLQNATITIG